MNKYQENKFAKHCNIWSSNIASFNWAKVPNSLKNCFSDDEMKQYLEQPLLRLNGGNILLVNEAFDGWEALKDILLSLDLLPDSLIIDIYKMDSQKFGKIDNKSVAGKDDDETKRRIILMFAPDVLWAHGIDAETIK